MTEGQTVKPPPPDKTPHVVAPLFPAVRGTVRVRRSERVRSTSKWQFSKIWKFGLRIKEHKKEVDSFTAGTQTQASRARESSVTHKSAITDHAHAME